MPDIASSQLTFSTVNLEHVYPKIFEESYDLKLFPNNIQLLIAAKKVGIIKGSLISKTITFDEEIITATYTNFIQNDKSQLVLAVCLRKSIYIYYPDGKSYIVSLPFILKNALPFELGLLLQKDNGSVIFGNNVNSNNHLNAASLLTLVDPIDDFRIVSTASTSIITQHEELMTFPKKDLSKKTSLCATFNSLDGSIIIYHIKSLQRNVKFNTTTQTQSTKPSSKFPKRRYGSITTTSSGRILEEDISLEVPPPYHSHQNQHLSLSFNMDKKRTSTLLSDVSSIGRMASDHYPAENKPSNSGNEFSSYKKDMILSKIEKFGKNFQRDHLRVFNLSFEDQEGIVVVNKLRKEFYVLIYKFPTSIKQISVYKNKGYDCLPLNSDEYEGNLLVLQHKKIAIINPFLNMTATSGGFDKPIKSFVSSYDSNLAVKTKGGEVVIIKVLLSPCTSLVQMCLKCFQYLSGSNINQTMWMLWRSAYNVNKDEWKAFVIALLSLIYPFKRGNEDVVLNEITELIPQAKVLHDISNLNYHIEDLIPYVVLSLHLLREECRLDSTKQSNYNKLGMLLCQLTSWMGWPSSWVNYYSSNLQSMDQKVKFLSVLILEGPPNLINSLASLFTSNISRYLTFSQLVEESDSVDADVTPRTYCILKLFEVLVCKQYGSNAIVDLMNELNISREELDTYPLGIAIPLKEALSISQQDPTFEWTNKGLDLVGREDLKRLISSENIFGSTPDRNQVEKSTMKQILFDVFKNNDSISPWDGQSEQERLSITKLMFDQDRRYYEITTLLHQTKTQTAYLRNAYESLSEYDLVLLQRELANIVALRTLTIPLGRAALFYGGRKPLLTEKFPIPKFNLNTLISPTMTNIMYSDEKISQNFFEWGHFHNGASSGLSINKEAKGISGSWVIFNKPPELNAQHAGFLLGLGLNGHLKKLEEWHIYNYLGPKHPLTSVGLLIGMTASSIGSMDNKLTKVLSVHAVALLPQGANDLNVPIMVQTAGLIGIGLLYLETQHRRMSEVLLSQITASVYQNDTEQVHEGYRLAAGISLGLVNLGQGDDLRGLNDTHVVDKLMSLAISMKDFQPVQELGKSCCGAIIAIGLIYLRTENKTIADKLKIPNNEQLLDYIRPDLLFLRCLCKNVIMWSEINCTIQWVENQIPKFLNDRYKNIEDVSLDSDQLGYLNILGGICMSIAIKYASTHNTIARDTLLHYFDQLLKLSSNDPLNYDQKVAYNSIINIQNVLALCLSVIMASSGDLEVFRRLRYLHNETSKESGFGGYMATNTALGFLFMGGGQIAFNNSNNLAIACLIISLYPTYPVENTEYEIHLQALRHFWALSVESRCLIIKDIKTNEPCKIPVLITMKDKSTKLINSPCLLPNLNEISKIETKSEEYFKINIDFTSNAEILTQFKKSLTLYVYKLKNYKISTPDISTILQNGTEIDDVQFPGSEIMQKLNAKDYKIWSFENKSNNLHNMNYISGLSIFNIIDDKLELMSFVDNRETNVEDLYNLKLLFEYADSLLKNDLHYISVEFIQELKSKLWAKIKSKN
ncbi:unnamed protein product [Candida verbasci]|uniref:Anaphase-promoting complex subunit 1 beta-sandwich domain-containing protein n=1 Tax=Candida verbasci TaxID=1227364 RepID=A0A9W4TYH5_9ASCO|nr:unnamed protein product [Candida verbasci]